MGACSSKPKTTEFEGSMEPRKPTAVPADQPQGTERSLDSLLDDHGKEAAIKAGEEEGAHASVEAVDVGQEWAPLSNSKEVAVHKEPKDEVEQKERRVDGVSDDAVQKDDVVGGGVSDKAVVRSNDTVDDKRDSVVDDNKICEDKAVVSEETGSSHGDASYVDKAVSLGEDKAPEAHEKRNIILPEEEASSGLDPAESTGIESPIIGLVQPVEPTNEKTAEEGVSKNVATEANPVRAHEDPQEEDAHEDSREDDKETEESPRDVDTDVSAIEDVQKDALLAAREDPSEGIEASAVEILASVGALETLSPAKADPLQDDKEGTSQPVIDVSPATMDSKLDVDEHSTDLKIGEPVDGNHNEVFHSKEVGDRDLADSEGSIFESKAEDVQESSVKEKCGLVVEETVANNGQTQDLTTKDADEDVRPIATPGQNESEREEKDEQIQDSKVGGGKETADKLHVEPVGGGHVAFEDASDAPLKLEASKSVESEQVPS